MRQVLDIVALRSLVGIADCGGFHRAGEVLRISQSAVSQHVRRLEKAVGRPLVERQGRQAGFTTDGHTLLAEAHPPRPRPRADRRDHRRAPDRPVRSAVRN